MLKQLGQNPNYLFSILDVEKMSMDEREELKWLCCTDLFFLANNICRSSNAKYKPLLRKVHGGICDTLVQKKPGVPFEDWSPIKQRVILSSRGTLKSVIEAVDIVQIILCDPNIRVMVMSGKLGLAKSILRMTRSHFEVNGVLGVLFPEWCAIGRTNVNEFISPARADHTLRDPTIQCATFGSTKAGSRADYIKLDDATNEVNQATPELVEKSIESYDDLDPLVEPGGYIDFTATRWAVDDLPEYIKYNGEQIEKETGRVQVKYFFQPVWTVKKIAEEHPDWLPEQISKSQTERDEREKRHRLVPDDVNLLWPEKLTAEFLWPQYVKNPRKFACQYLLNPESATHGVFTHALLVKQTRPLSECPLPHRSLVFINWDLSGVSGKGDFAVGMVGIWEDTGRLYIIDAIIEKFRSSTDICNAIIRLFKKYNPDHHRIESANGAELLSGELRMLAQRAGLDRAFYPGWDPPINEKDAKNTRIMLLPGALEANKIQFFSGIPVLPELYRQVESFTGKMKDHDDGPDCLAQMWQKWKDSVGPKAVGFLTPSGAVVDFQEPLVSANPDEDPHRDERDNADIEFLQNFTVPHSGH